MKCSNCGAQIDANSLFCTECGKQIPQGNVCSHCGAAAVNNDDTFCQNCGNKVDGGDGQQVPPVTTPEQKHCPHCGAVVSNDSLFCENCGRNMADGSPVPNMNFQNQVPYETRSSSLSKMIPPIIIIAGLLIIAIASGGGWWYYKSFKSKTSDFVVASNNTDSIVDVQETFVEDAVIEEVQDTIASDNIVEDLIVSEDFQYSDATTEYDAAKETASEKEITREQEMLPQQSETSNKVYETAERMPSFPGGAEALFKYLNSNMRYPEVAEENGVQGRVIVTFIVERDGAISDVKVAKSVDPSLDKEAVRIINSMPRWNPGTQDGKPVRVKYTVPITFRLQ